MTLTTSLIGPCKTPPLTHQYNPNLRPHNPRVCASCSQKPFRDFSRKKRNLLAWSLRTASASNLATQGKPSHKPKPTKRMSRTVPCDPEFVDVYEFFNQQPKSSGQPNHADRMAIDIDTLPNLEPYRREVVAQQPITFGHRPVSASRMFNPCTMATSCGIPSGVNTDPSGSGISRRKYGANITRRGASRTQRQPCPKRGRGSRTRRTTGLSAPMLKALLKGETQTGGGTTAAAVATARGDLCDTYQENFYPNGNNNNNFQDSTTRAAYMVLNGGQEELSDCSVNSNHLDEGMWRSVDPAGGGMRGDLEATWFTNSSQEGLRQGQGRLGGSMEGQELQRIFSDEVRTRVVSHTDG